MRAVAWACHYNNGIVFFRWFWTQYIFRWGKYNIVNFKASKTQFLPLYNILLDCISFEDDDVQSFDPINIKIGITLTSDFSWKLHFTERAKFTCRKIGILYGCWMYFSSAQYSNCTEGWSVPVRYTAHTSGAKGGALPPPFFLTMLCLKQFALSTFSHFLSLAAMLFYSLPLASSFKDWMLVCLLF